MWDSAFPERKLGEQLVRERRSFKPEEGTPYSLLGVRLYASGCHVHYEGAEALRAPSLSRLQVGDIVYNKMWASKGSFAVVGPEHAGAVATSEYPVFRARNGLATSYLRLVFEQPRFWALAKTWSNGTTGRARLNPGDFLSLPIPLPTRAEQTAMANVFRAVEELEMGTRRLLDEMMVAKHWTMRSLLTKGHPRFNNGAKDVPGRWLMGRVAPDISEIPSGWQLVHLTKVARLESGHTPSRKHPEYWDGNIPWLSLADTDELKRSAIESTAECITPVGVANSSARLLPVDSVVLSRTAVRGLCSTLARPMTTSQDFVVFVCGDRLHPRYLMQLFRHMQREWRRLEQGSSPTNKTLYFRVFKKVKILLPPMEEQEAIGEIGDAFDARIEAEQHYLRALEDLKRGLAKEMLSGRVRIPPELIAKLNDPKRRASG